MKIYFSAALTQKKKFGVFYNTIVSELERHGHTVFQDTTTTRFREAVEKNQFQRFAYYNQVVSWIDKADAVFLETSFPSTLHIGHEVSLALEHTKPTVALYYESHEPSFFLGKEDSLLFWLKYTKTTIIDCIKKGLFFAQQKKMVRYNCNLPLKHYAHLQRCSKHSDIAKSEYMRYLIEKDMKS